MATAGKFTVFTNSEASSGRHGADNAGTFSFIFVFAELYFSVTSPRRAHSLALYRIIASTWCGYFTNGHKTNVLKSLHQHL